MHRFFSENYLTLKQDDKKHIINVLRLRVNDKIIICDANKNDYHCTIVSISKNDLEVKLLEQKLNFAEPNAKITLFQALPKLDKMELIVQKCVELGVHAIVPVVTSRCVVKPKDDFSKKIDRLQKISEAAAKQSGRGIIPQIHNLVSFNDAIKNVDDLSIIAYENCNNTKIKDVLVKNVDAISIFIGPEGGFTDSEIDSAKKNNIKPVSLGSRILRTETAGFAALTILLNQLGEI